MDTSAIPIAVDGLTYRYGSKTALDNIAFELGSGEFLALLGPNGAGKTTIFSLLTRLLSPGSGSISLFGHRLDRSPGAALRDVGVVFQQPTLDLDLSVAQNLAYHGALHGMSPRRVRERMQTELERLGLGERMDERVRALNGGHRRRVEIARALLHEPRLLLLDEASAGLDLESRDALYRHVRSLCDSRGMAVLWTTHLVEELAGDDRTMVLDRGRIVASGSLDALREQQGTATANEALLALTGSKAS